MTPRLDDVTVKVHADMSEFHSELRRARRAANTLFVPAWCRNPWLRGFVMANALAFPISVIVQAVVR